MKTPDNIPLLMGKGYDNIIADVLANPDQPVQNMVRLSTAFPLQVIFKEPITLYLNRRKVKQNVKKHVFKASFFISNQSVYYKMKKGGRTGYQLPVGMIESYEPIGETNKFETYEDFKKMFDPFFINEIQIKSLWDSTSPQHGEKYKPSDFKSIGKAGKHALNMFLINFKGINDTPVVSYNNNRISGCYYGTGNSRSSRDVHVIHQLGRDYVHYQSEFSGCSNGTYGIIATKNKYLWVEND